jgi:putative transcriptional regulator
MTCNTIIVQVNIRKEGKKMSKRNLKIDLEEMMWQKRIKSISELSRKSGISRPTLYRIIKGEFDSLNVSTLINLCDSLDCEINDLLVIKE